MTEAAVDLSWASLATRNPKFIVCKVSHIYRLASLRGKLIEINRVELLANFLREFNRVALLMGEINRVALLMGI